MDKTSGNQNENSSNIEAMIPAGLTGQIRDKARDALMTATVILGMSRTDILDRIQDLAKENGLTPQSARVWLLFSKEMQDQARAVGQRVGDQGSRNTFAQDLGYKQVRGNRTTLGDTATLGLGAVFRRGATGTGIGENAADDMRVELNHEAGHHANSISGKNGAFSYDQMVDGWGGAGGGGRDADGVGLDLGLEGQDGDTGLDMETENEFGADGLQLDIDDHERRHGDSVMTPVDLHDVQLPDGRQRGASGHEIDRLDVFRAGKGGLSGGWHKNASRRNATEASVERAETWMDRVKGAVGGFPGTDDEFSGFAKANPDLDKNQLRLLRKGMNSKNYLGFRSYVENGHLLSNTGNGRGHGDGRIVTQTRACLLMTSDDAARSAQNAMRAKIELFSRIPPFPKEKISIEHAIRMAKPLSRLADEYAAENPDEVKKYKEGLRRDKEKKMRPKPGLER